MEVKDIIQTLPRHPTARYKNRMLNALTHVVVHHSATTDGSPEAFARYHISQNWPGIGYHYVIGRDGQVYKCQPASVISYHASDANSYSIGVCLVGNFDIQRPTLAQMESLKSLLVDLVKGYGISPDHIVGHREIPNTRKSCPGNNVDMNQIRKDVKEILRGRSTNAS